jgi:hypothetical protein
MHERGTYFRLSTGFPQETRISLSPMITEDLLAIFKKNILKVGNNSDRSRPRQCTVGADRPRHVGAGPAQLGNE